MHFGTQPLDSSIAESEGGGPSANDLEIDFVAEAMLMDMDVQVVQDNLDVELPENAAHFHSNQPNLQSSSFHIEYYPGAAEIKSKEKTFMDIFDNDEHASKRCSNLYYPFASAKEWEVASFLLKSGLSMTKIDEFLKLELVSNIFQILII
jgi:hypothetical protein